MSHPPIFLSVFDVPKIEKFFSNDYASIQEFFEMAYKNIGNDLSQIATSFANNDIAALRDSLHTVMPIFNLLGLQSVEQDLRSFHVLCKGQSSQTLLRDAYTEIWPKLMMAKEAIAQQHALFSSNSQ
jgi:hypothetical protein